jgi:hypothetical protein
MMTRTQQVFARPETLSARARACSTVRTEKAGDFKLAVVEHLHASGDTLASYSITRSRLHKDGSLGRPVSYGLPGFDDLDSAREFGLAWCRESTGLQSA